ncbi:hypothetical protein GCM10010503_26430 [Streptomyces lucensis JCM 4490]|uniref:Uncharacterized protein n=1 Tax=Streptomyces lucensis JCM 4490 TaxID=1306176 RepID=A0A918MRR1_9ACTN|nr:hypothetical protein [Streptomyces lucensis]GGW48095.1 hypothetical protein GCM10010503_26430 [Streptomyces lucensis JCM 4490]
MHLSQANETLAYKGADAMPTWVTFAIAILAFVVWAVASRRGG